MGGWQSLHVIEIPIAGQAAVDRLPQQIRQPELRVQAVAGVAQVFCDDRLQTEAFIQLANQNQASSEMTRDPETRLQKPIERELKKLGFFSPRGCHSFWRSSSSETARNRGVTTDRIGNSTTAKSEIRGNRAAPRGSPAVR